MRLFRFALVLITPISIFGADTGKGAFPISSVWVRSTSQLYKAVIPASTETAARDVITDWFFQAAAPPPATDLQDPVGRGVVPFER